MRWSPAQCMRACCVVLSRSHTRDVVVLAEIAQIRVELLFEAQQQRETDVRSGKRDRVTGRAWESHLLAFATVCVCLTSTLCLCVLAIFFLMSSSSRCFCARWKSRSAFVRESSASNSSSCDCFAAASPSGSSERCSAWAALAASASALAFCARRRSSSRCSRSRNSSAVSSPSFLRFTDDDDDAADLAAKGAPFLPDTTATLAGPPLSDSLPFTTFLYASLVDDVEDARAMQTG